MRDNCLPSVIILDISTYLPHKDDPHSQSVTQILQKPAAEAHKQLKGIDATPPSTLKGPLLPTKYARLVSHASTQSEKPIPPIRIGRERAPEHPQYEAFVQDPLRY